MEKCLNSGTVSMLSCYTTLWNTNPMKRHYSGFDLWPSLLGAPKMQPMSLCFSPTASDAKGLPDAMWQLPHWAMNSIISSGLWHTMTVWSAAHVALQAPASSAVTSVMLRGPPWCDENHHEQCKQPSRLTWRANKLSFTSYLYSLFCLDFVFSSKCFCTF